MVLPQLGAKLCHATLLVGQQLLKALRGWGWEGTNRETAAANQKRQHGTTGVTQWSVCSKFPYF